MADEWKLTAETVELLKQLARPFIDKTPEDVVRNLIAHFYATKDTVTAVAPEEEPQRRRPRRVIDEGPPAFTTSRGTKLPVGLVLKATYRDEPLRAKVTTEGIEYGGNVYGDPSAAAKQAKVDLGADPEAAQTNGWIFWSFNSKPRRIAKISRFREDPKRAWAEFEEMQNYAVAQSESED